MIWREVENNQEKISAALNHVNNCVLFKKPTNNKIFMQTILFLRYRDQQTRLIKLDLSRKHFKSTQSRLV